MSIFKETENIGLGNRNLQLARAPRCGCGPSTVQIGRPPRFLVRRVEPAGEDPDRALHRHPSGGIRRAVQADPRSTEQARNRRRRRNHHSASRNIKRSPGWRCSHVRNFLRGHLVVGIGRLFRGSSSSSRLRLRHHRSGSGNLRDVPRRLARLPRHDARARQARLHARPQTRRPLERRSRLVRAYPCRARARFHVRRCVHGGGDRLVQVTFVCLFFPPPFLPSTSPFDRGVLGPPCHPPAGGVRCLFFFSNLYIFVGVVARSSLRLEGMFCVLSSRVFPLIDGILTSSEQTGSAQL